MTTLITIFAIAVLCCLLGSMSLSRRWDDAEAAMLRTDRIIATVRQQQRTPSVVERNLAARLRREMQYGRECQVSQLYAELERI